MVPETPTALTPEALVTLAVTAAGDMDDPNTYGSRLVETMAVLTELALPDLAAQIIAAGKETSKAGSPFNYFIRGILREVNYDESSNRGFVWVEPMRFGDDEVAKARSGADKDKGWKLARDGKTPLELFKTERVFYAQGRAVYDRAKQLIGHRVTIVKHIYGGKDGNNHRDVVAIIDRGQVRGATQRPAPAPAPVEEPAEEAAPAPVEEPAPAPKAAPAEEAAPAPLAVVPDTPADADTNTERPLVAGMDPADPAFVPVEVAQMTAAYTALGLDSEWVHAQVNAAKNDKTNPRNYASPDPAMLAEFWTKFVRPEWERRNPELAAAMADSSSDEALEAALMS